MTLHHGRITGERQFVVEENGLEYYAARNSVICAHTPSAQAKLCRVTFGSDGSIYVMFPYLAAKQGVLSVLEDPAPSSGPVTYDLGQNGVTVLTDIKFAHHRSGTVHFSKTNGPLLLPEKQSFKLEGSIGRVFDLFVYWLRGFKRFTKPDRSTLKLQVDFATAEPVGLRISAEWRRKRDILDNAVGDGRAPIRASTLMMHQRTKEVSYTALLGQPAGLPLRDHVLLFTAKPQPFPSGADVPTMIFLGGQDDHDVTDGGELPYPRRFLAFMYPSGAASRLAL